VGLVSSAVLYLPTVAGSFVTAIMASSLGFADGGRLALAPTCSPGWPWSPCCCIDSPP
jgi:hypothetical protein